MKQALDDLHKLIANETGALRTQLQINETVERLVNYCFNSIKELTDRVMMLENRCKKLEGMIYPLNAEGMKLPVTPVSEIYRAAFEEYQQNLPKVNEPLLTNEQTKALEIKFQGVHPVDPDKPRIAKLGGEKVPNASDKEQQ